MSEKKYIYGGDSIFGPDGVWVASVHEVGYNTAVAREFVAAANSLPPLVALVERAIACGEIEGPMKPEFVQLLAEIKKESEA